MPFKILVEEPGYDSQSFTFVEDFLLIGDSEHCDIEIPDLGYAKEQFRLTLKKDGIDFENLSPQTAKAKHGGTPIIETTHLPLNDKVVIASITLRVKRDRSRKAPLSKNAKILQIAQIPLGIVFLVVAIFVLRSLAQTIFNNVDLKPERKTQISEAGADTNEAGADLNIDSLPNSSEDDSKKRKKVRQLIRSTPIPEVKAKKTIVADRNEEETEVDTSEVVDRPEVAGDDLAQYLLDAGTKHLAERQYSRAFENLVLIVRNLVDNSDAQQQQARDLIRSAKRQALDEFYLLKRQSQQIFNQRGPAFALMPALSSEPRFRSLGFDPELEKWFESLQKSLTLSLSRENNEIQQEQRFESLIRQVRAYSFRLKHAAAKASADALLVDSLSHSQRLQLYWTRHQIQAFATLIDEFKALVAKQDGSFKPKMKLVGDVEGTLVGLEDDKLVFRSKSGAEVFWPWKLVQAVHLQELLKDFKPKNWQFSKAKAFHAFNTGLEDFGFRALMRQARSPRTKGEAFSFYALATGEQVPDGGFLIENGRFISPATKAAILARRREALELQRSIDKLSRDATAAKRLAKILVKIVSLYDSGQYEAGTASLAKLVKKHADVKSFYAKAKKKLDSVVLRRRDVKLALKTGKNGRSSNRLDIYLLGDGFVLNDNKQIQFDRYSLSATKIIQQQDFFREYDSYINYWSCNLRSNEEGVSMNGVPKDTALGTEITNGRYTATDISRIIHVLGSNFGDEHDELAVVIGNEHANIATGGGGVAAVPKTALGTTPHELGHAFGALGDEYDQEPGPNPGTPSGHKGAAEVIAPNVVAASSRSEAMKVVPWADWNDASGEKNWTLKPIGAFEGANRQAKQFWRPQKSCVMRDVGTPFCAVCMEVMLRRLYVFVNTIDESGQKMKL